MTKYHRIADAAAFVLIPPALTVVAVLSPGWVGLSATAALLAFLMFEAWKIRWRMTEPQLKTSRAHNEFVTITHEDAAIVGAILATILNNGDILSRMYYSGERIDSVLANIEDQI